MPNCPLTRRSRRTWPRPTASKRSPAPSHAGFCGCIGGCQHRPPLAIIEIARPPALNCPPLLALIASLVVGGVTVLYRMNLLKGEAFLIGFFDEAVIDIAIPLDQ